MTASADQELYLDRFGDTWEDQGARFHHVARADEGASPNTGLYRMTWPAEKMDRDFGPLVRIGEQQ